MFRDLRENDPLYRRMEKRPLTIRRMFAPSRGPGTAISLAASTSSRVTSASSMSRPSSLKSSTCHRQVNVTENVEEEAEDGADDAGPDESASDVQEPSSSLEEILQTEAGVLAAELNEAEHEGIDPAVLYNLERAAETLVTV